MAQYNILSVAFCALMCDMRRVHMTSMALWSNLLPNCACMQVSFSPVKIDNLVSIMLSNVLATALDSAIPR